MPPVYARKACGFECGEHTWAIEDEWTHLSPFDEGPDSFAITTNLPRTGSYSLEWDMTSSQDFAWQGGLFGTNGGSNPEIITKRVYVRFASLPSDDAMLYYAFSNDGQEGIYGVGYHVSSGTLRTALFSYSTGNWTWATSGAAVTTGQWYLIDLELDASSNPWTVSGEIDETPVAGVSISQAAGTWDDHGFGGGVDNDFSVHCYFDDYLIEYDNPSAFPLGPGIVVALHPNADGTHDIDAANEFERTATGTDITNATTDAYLLVDDDPIAGGYYAADEQATDYVLMLAADSDDYVEFAFEDLAGEFSAIRLVEVLAAIRPASASAAAVATLVVNDEGDLGTAIPAGPSSLILDVTVNHRRGSLATAPGSGSAWTQSEVNAVKVRWGHSTDADPDIQLHSLIIEVEGIEALGAIVEDAAPILVELTFPATGHALSQAAPALTVEAALQAVTTSMGNGASPVVVEVSIPAVTPGMTPPAASSISVETTGVTAGQALSHDAAPLSVEAVIQAIASALVNAAAPIAVTVTLPEAPGTTGFQEDAAPIVVEVAVQATAQDLAQAAAPIGVEAEMPTAGQLLSHAAAVMAVEAALQAVGTSIGNGATPIAVEVTLPEAAGSTGRFENAEPILVELTFTTAAHALEADAAPVEVEVALPAAGQAMSHDAAVMAVETAVQQATQSLEASATPITLLTLLNAVANALVSAASPLGVDAAMPSAARLLVEDATPIIVEVATQTAENALTADAEPILVVVTLPEATPEGVTVYVSTINLQGRRSASISLTGEKAGEIELQGRDNPDIDLQGRR